MNKISYLLFLFLAACSLRNSGTKPGAEKDLFAIMKIRDIVKIGEPVEFDFTVYNHTDSVKRFLKWQTPFEPLMSKYLDIKNEQGEEIPYKGPMAKRMMPPPANAYIELSPMDSLVVKVDILRGYDLDKAGKYTITYISGEMNGLKVRRPVSFIYK